MYEGSHFVVGHGPLERSTKGTLLVVSKRHFLDFGEMRPAESRALATILGVLFPAIKRVTGSDRVYLVATMDGAPHFHLWLVPKPSSSRLRGVRYLASHHPPVGKRAAEGVVRRVREALPRRGQ